MINGFIMIQAKKYAKNLRNRSHKILNVSAKKEGKMRSDEFSGG
jgi:hypothetical protein